MIEFRDDPAASSGSSFNGFSVSGMADNLKVVTAGQMAALEQAAAGVGVSTDALMEQAGLAVAQAIRGRWDGIAGVRILVLAGPGNNGADGLVAARHLRRWGAEVAVYLAAGWPANPKPDNKLAAKVAAAGPYAIPIQSPDTDPDFALLDNWLDGSRLILDAVLGTGRSRPLAGTVREVLRRVNLRRERQPRPLLAALDLPTGLDADSGAVDEFCPSADFTLALAYPKVGLLSFPGAEKVGELQALDIGLPAGLGEGDIPLELLTADWVAGQPPPRPRNAHKGTFGHALIVAGSRPYAGAAVLAAAAAARAGAGLVTLAAPQTVYLRAAALRPEIIHLPLPEDAAGRVQPTAAAVIRAALPRYSSMAVGSGLGQSAGVTEFIHRLLLTPPYPALPTVVDADGLNCLAQLADWPQRMGTPLILTPHPGEMATLTGLATATVQQERINLARHYAAEWGAVVVLKGAYTVIAEPGRQHPSGLVRLSPFANPALATGGTGDVLTGIIAGLLAQGLDGFAAASCGVYRHGAAAAKLPSGGLLAGDLLAAI